MAYRSTSSTSRGLGIGWWFRDGRLNDGGLCPSRGITVGHRKAFGRPESALESGAEASYCGFDFSRTLHLQIVRLKPDPQRTPAGRHVLSFPPKSQWPAAAA